MIGQFCKDISRRPALGLVLCLMPFLVACEEATQQTVVPPQTVKVYQVTAEAGGFARDYPALVTASQEAELAFKVSGQLIELPARASQQVKQGDVLARLDASDYQASVDNLKSQLAQANAQLSAMQGGARPEDVAVARAGVKSSEAKLTEARAAYSRMQQLVTRGVAPRAQLDPLLSAMRVAEAEVETSKQKLKAAETGSRAEDVEAQQAAIAGIQSQLGQAETDLANTTLRAPFAGLIASRKVDNFANVSANTAIVTLQSTETLDLLFNLPGPDVAELSKMSGQLQGYATLDATGDNEFETELVEFATEPNPATQTYESRVRIARPKEVAAVLPGMAGRVWIRQTADGGSSALSVPASALVARPDGSVIVWKVTSDGKSVEAATVTAGAARKNSVLITSGLAAGDTIVSAGASRLREGVTIRPINAVGE
ncbi:MAG: hypothetical protein Alpg2KO_00300 [Alphaproteobacteria bacterium]